MFSSYIVFFLLSCWFFYHYTLSFSLSLWVTSSTWCPHVVPYILCLTVHTLTHACTSHIPLPDSQLKWFLQLIHSYTHTHIHTLVINAYTHKLKVCLFKRAIKGSIQMRQCHSNISVCVYLCWDLGKGQSGRCSDSWSGQPKPRGRKRAFKSW